VVWFFDHNELKQEALMGTLTRDIWRPDLLLRCWTSEIGSGGISWHSAARRIIVRRPISWIDAGEKLMEEDVKMADASNTLTWE
jgi:hypothetical protein